jgi:NTP pyrophosphatase (non-canonical NTP hydrolase)
MDALDVLRLEARRFAEERDWQSFHTPKNLAIAVSVEAGELLEVFQWLADGDVESLASAGTTWQAAREMADVLINLVRLADVLGVDRRSALSRRSSSLYVDTSSRAHPAAEPVSRRHAHAGVEEDARPDPMRTGEHRPDIGSCPPRAGRGGVQSLVARIAQVFRP